MVNPEKSVVGRERVFSSKTRLRRHADFQYIRRHGRSAVGRFCVIRVVNPAPDGCRRVAFVISRHYSKRAVDRNRARRLFRERFRLLAPRLNDCWIEFRPRAFMLRDVKLQDVAPEIDRLLRTLGAFREQPSGTDV
ncbi:MAG: ribonuclease P protein component [Lentisphaeria bacterium]|nr:ribonuclease P protein component [Lentisphaeria bacterium]